MELYLSQVPPVVFALFLCLLLLVAAVVIALLLQFAAECFSGGSRPYNLPLWVRAALPILILVTAVVVLHLVRPIWREPMSLANTIAFWAVLVLGIYLAVRIGSRVTYWKDAWQFGKTSAIALILVALFGAVASLAIGDLPPENGGPNGLPPDNGAPPVRALPGTVSLHLTTPWHESVKVGETVQMGVSVSNNSGAPISGLIIAPDGESVELVEDPAPLRHERLESTATLGPLIFQVRFPRPGRQDVRFKVSYVDEAQQARDVSNVWAGDVAGPRLTVTRYIFSSDVVNAGQVVDVQVVVKNTGLAPLYGLHLEPNLLGHFQLTSIPDWPDVLESGKEYTAFYSAVADTPGEGPLQPPVALFLDGADNRYDTVQDPEAVDMSVSNSFCTSPRQCQAGERIRVASTDPGVAQPPIASTSLSPVVLNVDPSSESAQFQPGVDHPHSLIVSHDGENQVYLKVELVNSARLALNGFDRTIPLAPGEKKVISGSVSVPSDTPLGVYHPVLQLQQVDLRGDPLRVVPHTVTTSFTVTLVKIERIITHNELGVGDEVNVETIVTNVSDQVLTVNFVESFKTGGMSVSYEVQSPGGGDSESRGNLYQNKRRFEPGETVKRVFNAKANESGLGLLEGTANYSTLDDSTNGSVKHSTLFTVR